MTRLRIIAIMFGLMGVATYVKGGDPTGFFVGMCIMLAIDWLVS